MKGSTRADGTHYPPAFLISTWKKEPGMRPATIGDIDGNLNHDDKIRKGMTTPKLSELDFAKYDKSMYQIRWLVLFFCHMNQSHASRIINQCYNYLT